jgi:hypothetical protein
MLHPILKMGHFWEVAFSNKFARMKSEIEK